jgi:hypothetical protein
MAPIPRVVRFVTVKARLKPLLESEAWLIRSLIDFVENNRLDMVFFIRCRYLVYYSLYFRKYRKKED